MTTTTPPITATPAKFIIDTTNYCNRVTKLRYQDAPEPLGADYGLDRPVANKIAQFIYDTLKAAGGNPRDVCREMRPMDEARLRNAYERRGLNGDPS